MFTRMAIYALFAVLMRPASAHIDEIWACNTKIGSMRPEPETATIEGDQLSIGGKDYTIFDDNKDHVLAGTVSREKGNVITSYIVFERISGRMTEFDNSVQVILKGGCCDAPSSRSVCTRER